ncbi:MAG: hypothetical protein Q9174_005866 [Haloplaca sp. 1 TL-2023]
MLRNERATRRITHPHLTYSTAGTLICLVCHVQIKTEALWSKHLNTSQHAANVQKASETRGRQADSTEDAERVNGSKKRKASDDSSEDDDTRKRTKGGTSENGSNLPAEIELHEASRPDMAWPDSTSNGDRKRKRPQSEGPLEDMPAPPPKAAPRKNASSTHLSPDPNARPASLQSDPSPDIDEDEWAAFQREVASPPPESSALTALADISAAPMTAAELAAQSREQASTQAKERMEAEVEGEKEDAARQMEEEFEDMAELEDRVRRLREKREALRMKLRQKGEEGDSRNEEMTLPPNDLLNGDDGDDGGGSEDDDDDEEIDEWGTWGRA